MDRRTVLRGGLASAGGLATASLVACVPPVDPAATGPFDCGVASGVHSDEAVVLWTRFAPAATSGSVQVTWQVAADAGFSRVVARGTGSAAPGSDGCVKVLAEGLRPGTTYWYRFQVDGLVSPLGRTRTLPAAGREGGAVRLAVTSCQDYQAGFYPAWRAIASDDVDAVVHLGDYIYESGGTTVLDVRSDGLDTAKDLAGYRSKYRVTRGDPDLQAAHAAHPFAMVWDDHEFVNDYNRLTVRDEAARRRAAYRAWWEYQPVWPIQGDRIYRTARWGRLAELVMIDTRQYRDPPPMVDGESVKFGATNAPPIDVVHDADRTILGAEQRSWLFDSFTGAQDDGVTWKFLANQVMVSPIRLVDLDEPLFRELDPTLPEHAGVYVNFDDWSGYQWERGLLTDHLHDEGVANVGILTGDIHSFWQSRVLRDLEEESGPVVAQEFVCGSITSRGLDYAGDLAPEIARALTTTRPGFRFVDLTHRGYGVLTATPEAASVEYLAVDALSRRGARRRIARFDWPEGTHDVTLSRG
jgi:alkaline phosphatase D